MKKGLILVFLFLFFISCSDNSSVKDDDVIISDDSDEIEAFDIDDNIAQNDEGSQVDENDEVIDNVDEMVGNDDADMDEEIFVPECVEDDIKFEDCNTSGKQEYYCFEGHWFETGKCIDITAEVIDIAESSSCIGLYWEDRGDAPAAYIKGMGLIFAGAVCNKERSDVILAYQAKTEDLVHDSLAWYDDIDIFSDLGMSNDASGLETLRHAYTLLTGLGMRESSGEHCCGRDTSATNTTAETAEAGLFQTSYNSHVFSTELDILYSYWKDVKTLTPEKCLLDVFSENVTCSSSNWENFGVGEGLLFQALEKECPTFTVEYAAVMLRVSGGSGGHYGPLRRREAEVRIECDSMLGEIQTLVEENPLFCEFLVNY